jgi:hypothetical protein
MNSAASREMSRTFMAVLPDLPSVIAATSRTPAGTPAQAAAVRR